MRNFHPSQSKVITTRSTFMMTFNMFPVLVLIGLLQGILAMHKSPSCIYPAWVPNTDYCAGERVSHNSAQYESLWCTQEEPGTGQEYDGWSSLGPCATTSPTPTPTPTPTSTPTDTATPTPTPTPTVTSTPAPGEAKVVGYFASWKVYYDYYFKNVDTSGSAAMLTHIVYAFGGVNAAGECYMVDTEADIEKYFNSDTSVDGSTDTWDQPLRGNFNQILQLKKKYPHLKMLWSFGGWTLSGNFGVASQNPEKFAKSCYDLVYNSQWAGVFDGIDIDWEYPNACGAVCDDSGPDAYAKLLSALKAQFGDALVTSAITGDGSEAGKIDATDYYAGAKHLDFMMVMTYDYFGAWDATGPTALQAPLNPYTGIPNEQMVANKAIQKLKDSGIPSEKLLLGIGFYGRGWTGVTQDKPGGSATGPAMGQVEPGVDDYKVLIEKCPSTGLLAGTSYSYCSPDWWTYDIPETVRFKGQYAAAEGLGGMFAWELSGDTPDAVMLTAMTTQTRTMIRTRRNYRRCKA